MVHVISTLELSNCTHKECVAVFSAIEMNVYARAGGENAHAVFCQNHLTALQILPGKLQTVYSQTQYVKNNNVHVQESHWTALQDNLHSNTQFYRNCC